MYILRFLVPSDWSDNILSEITSNQCKSSCAGGNNFSEICFHFDINNRGFEFFILLADIEGKKRIKSLIFARCYVGLGYHFIHTKEFNSKQGCITLHPRKFLVGERQIIINRGVSI